MHMLKERRQFDANWILDVPVPDTGRTSSLVETATLCAQSVSGFDKIRIYGEITASIY
jgi:hypothetical protein